MNVLIIDDVARNRKLLRVQLEAEGVVVSEAGDGIEALSELKRTKIDAAISDILMPRMDGYRFCYEVRKSEQFRNLPLIMYTATYTSPGDEKLSFDLGADKYLRKPSSPRQILDALNEVTKRTSRPASTPPVVEMSVLKEYTERLVAKVAERSAELTERNAELEQLTEKLELEVEERKAAEELLREQAELLDLAHDAIMVLDLESRIKFWNGGAQTTYGWTSAEALEFPTVECLYTDPETYDFARRSVLKNTDWSGEMRQVRKDGTPLIVNSRWTLLRNPAGEPKSILVINSDITVQRSLEAQFLRAQRVESIGTLASGVAHDLNNILAPILMGAAVLRRTDMPAADNTILSTIETCAQRGADIVKQVLTFARGAEGERLLLQPADLMNDVRTIAKETFPKAITVRAQISERLWAIQGDPTHLHQVLLNLCVNARDAMPAGGTLTLSAENFTVDEHYASMTAGAKAGPYVVLEVTDTGMGIPCRVIGKIFDPFFTTKELGQGTGLGLSTVIGIVKSHGGFVGVESEIGCGTTFKIFLPARQGEFANAPSPEAPPLPPANGELLLLVDDEKSILLVARALLEDHGYQVLTAADAAEALAIFALRKDEIDLVLTDLAMPFMDGVALIRTLRKMKPDVKVIASTGRAGREDHASELASLKVRACLTKPYNKTKLLKTLRDVLQEPQENNHL
ncbi:MAG: hybrid sensor histidine kinase/response regulator [Chthoniobacterales bacterium]|nr:MAG: hybrid sensor histidine kinase/response regulator [Chthoniobacterales bacterium]